VRVACGSWRRVHGKADVVARSLHGDLDLPAAAVRGTQETLWLIDAEAAARV